MCQVERASRVKPLHEDAPVRGPGSPAVSWGWPVLGAWQAWGAPQQQLLPRLQAAGAAAGHPAGALSCWMLT
jgi:hypothetical protein